MKVGEEYHKKLKELLFHAFHRKFISTRVALKMYQELVASHPGEMMITKQDHADGYQPTVDSEFQTEHFGKQARGKVMLQRLLYHPMTCQTWPHVCARSAV